VILFDLAFYRFLDGRREFVGGCQVNVSVVDEPKEEYEVGRKALVIEAFAVALQIARKKAPADIQEIRITRIRG